MGSLSPASLNYQRRDFRNICIPSKLAAIILVLCILLLLAPLNSRALQSCICICILRTAQRQEGEIRLQTKPHIFSKRL